MSGYPIGATWELRWPTPNGEQVASYWFEGFHGTTEVWKWHSPSHYMSRQGDWGASRRQVANECRAYLPTSAPRNKRFKRVK